MIRWRGEKYGRPAEGTVHGGVCAGSFEVVSEVEAMVAAGAQVAEGPWTMAPDLTDPRAARALLRIALDDGTAEFEGDEAAVENVPEGAES